MTLASPQETRSLREWMTDQFVTQIELHQDPRSYPDWLVEHPLQSARAL